MGTTEKQLPAWQQIPMSGVAGSLAWLPTHPWELAKNRVILAKEPLSTLGAFRQMYETGSTFNGLGAGIMRQVIYGAFRLGLYEPIRGISTSVRGGSEVTPSDRIFAGATAGIIGSFLSSPVEVALVMQSSAPAEGTRLSLPQTFLAIYRNRGVPGFWAGSTPLMTRAAIVGVAQVSFNDQCKVWLKRYVGAASWNPNSLSLLSGVLTGVFYAAVTMPVDIVRVTMSSSKVKVGIAASIRKYIATHGIMAIYAPFFPYCMRCVIHTATSFVILDYFRRVNTVRRL